MLGLGAAMVIHTCETKKMNEKMFDYFGNELPYKDNIINDDNFRAGMDRILKKLNITKKERNEKICTMLILDPAQRQAMLDTASLTVLLNTREREREQAAPLEAYNG